MQSFGFLDTAFLSCKICTGHFALSQTTFVVLNLYHTLPLSCVYTYLGPKSVDQWQKLIEFCWVN